MCVLKDFPVFFGCVDTDPKDDLFTDMYWCIDPETGAIDTQGVIDRAEDVLGTESDVDILKNLETETDDDEETEE